MKFKDRATSTVVNHNDATKGGFDMKKVLLAALVAVTALFFANNALADNPGNGFQVSTAKATSTVKFSVKFNFIGTYVNHTKGLKKKNGKVVGCFTAYGTWTNSVRTPVIKAYRETSRAKFCPLNKPVMVNGVRYTHVKTAGGKTGNPCWNLAIPPGKPQPKPQIGGPVLDVRSMANVEIPVKVEASANASVWGTMQCPGGAVGASASGRGAINGTIRVKISQSLLMSNRGRVSGPVRAYIEQQIRTSVEGSAKADAVASITVSCGPSVVPPNPVCPPGTTGTWPNCSYPPPTSAVHSCSISWTQDKAFSNVVYVTVNNNGGVASVRYYWDYSRSSSYEQVQATQYSHSYPVQAPGPYGSGVTYNIRAVAVFTDGNTADCGSQNFWYPAPAPGGGTTTPPPPGG